MIIKDENIKRIAVISLFWGSLWGIAEATLGYAIHVFKFFPGVAGFVMFPIGFYFMNRAYRESGSIIALLSTSGAAAAVKLVDLFLPGLTPIYTLNPALAILMEGTLVMVIYRVIRQKQRSFRFGEVLLAAAGWRAAFISYCFILMIFSIPTEFFQRGLINILRFFILDSLVNAALITVFLTAHNILTRIRPRERSGILDRAFHKGLAFSILVFTMAVLTRLILNLV